MNIEDRLPMATVLGVFASLVGRPLGVLYLCAWSLVHRLSRSAHRPIH